MVKRLYVLSAILILFSTIMCNPNVWSCSLKVGKKSQLTNGHKLNDIYSQSENKVSNENVLYDNVGGKTQADTLSADDPRDGSSIFWAFYNEASKAWSKFHFTNDELYLIEALELIGKAIDADRSFYRAYFLKSEILSKLGKYVEAIETLNEALTKTDTKNENETASLYELRGIVKQKMGKKQDAYRDYDMAIELFGRRLERDAKNMFAIANTAQILILRGRKSEAIRFLQQLIERYPDEKWLQGTLDGFKDFNVEHYFEVF